MFSISIPQKPFNGGHIIIKLSKPFHELTLQELVELKKKIEAAVLVMKKRLRPEGFNILLLEDQIHVIPRWCGDINVAFFGGLKVVPMSVEQMSDIAREIYESNS